MAVAMDGALAFLETGEPVRRQGLQQLLFLTENGSHLLARGAVNAQVGHGFSPVGQVLVLRGQAVKLAPGSTLIRQTRSGWALRSRRTNRLTDWWEPPNPTSLTKS